jgi:hypothetical protein
MASNRSSPDSVGATQSAALPVADLVALAVLIEAAAPATPPNAHVMVGETLLPALTETMSSGNLALRRAARHARNAASAIERGEAFRGSMHTDEAIRLFRGGVAQLRGEHAPLAQAFDARRAQERLNLLKAFEPAIG